MERMRRADALINNQVYKSNQDDTEEFFKKINAIPAYMVSMKINPQFKFYKNGRNFLSDEPKKWNQFTAFYYSESTNSIVNGGSAWYNWWDANSRWDNANLVRHTYDTDWKWVARWFKENFKI